jgi:hypothetical protein
MRRANFVARYIAPKQAGAKNHAAPVHSGVADVAHAAASEAQMLDAIGRSEVFSVASVRSAFANVSLRKR